MEPFHLFMSYLSLMLFGVLWGFREKVHQNPSIFHKLFPKAGIAPISFFGKQMWKMKDRPQSRTARQLLDWFPVNDYWHSSWYLGKTLIVIGIWLAFESNGWFWDFRNFLPLFAWVTVITMFWGGFTNWLIGSAIRKKQHQTKN